MRLTLRTLLAYLDDTLDPTEIKEIGQKVAESDTAQELVARIKQVTRRRRLTTPPATGPNARFDANTVAEYLDSVLPSEQVAEVEKTCLESDVHLAEIAACHQILTLVLGEPALVPPPARRRMYALAEGKGGVSRKPRPRAAVAAGPAGDGNEADETLLLGLPPLSRIRRMRWLVPAAAALLLAGLGVAIYMAIPRRPDLGLALNQRPTNRDTAPPPPDKPRDQAAADPDYETLDRPPRVEVAAAPNGAAGTQTTQKSSRPSTERMSVGRLIATPTNLLLQRPRGKDAWRRVKPEADPVHTDDLLLTLPGYRSELRLDNRVHLLLWGNVPEQLGVPLLESAVTLHAVPAGKEDAPAVDFTLERGRVVIKNQKGEPVRVRVRFHEEVWDLTLQDPGAEVALDLIGREGVYESGEGPLASLFLVVLKGHVNLRAGYHQHALSAPAGGMPGPAVVVWNNEGPGLQGPQALQAIPPFWSPTLPASWQWERMTPAEQKAQLKLYEDVQLSLDEMNRRLIDKSLNVVLSEDVVSPKPAARVLGVLALGAVDSLSPLLDALADEKSDVREAAVTALRHYLARGDGQDKKLRQALADKHYTTTQSDIILHLLHRFSAEDLAKKQTYEVLIEYLKHDRPEVRQLAYWHLVRLSPEGRKTIPYNPSGGVQERLDAYEAWKRLLADGKVPSKIPSPPPK